MAVQITCISKASGHHTDSHHAIEFLGWTSSDGTTGKSTRLQIYEFIEANGHTSTFVKDARGNVAYVGNRQNANGTKYVQTYADEVWTDNLLSLPECPA